MSRIVVINGSPKKAGASRTHTFAEAFCSDLRETLPSLKTEFVSLSERDVQPCRGCVSCTTTGSCVLDDEVPAIRATIRESDLVVLASPVHLRHVSSLFQNLVERFLVDPHTFPYIGKPFCSLVTTNGSGEEDAIKYLTKIGLLLGGVNLGATFHSDADGVHLKSRQRLLRKAAAALADKSKVKPSLMNSLYFKSMRDIIKRNEEYFPYESRLWRERGWLDANYKAILRKQ